MVSRATWKNNMHKRGTCTKSAGRVQFCVIEKLARACYFQIALKTMLLLIKYKRKYSQMEARL